MFSAPTVHLPLESSQTYGARKRVYIPHYKRQNRIYEGDRVHPPYTPLGSHLGYLFLHRVPRTHTTNHIHQKENILDENNRPLTAKQQQFCREYLIDMNAAAAARRAGYSERTSEQQGSRLLRNVEVEAEIRRLVDERAKRVELDADLVVQRLLWESDPDNKDTTPASRVNALGLLGRHLSMFVERIDMQGDREQIWIMRGDPPDEGGEEQPKLTLPKAQARLDELGEQEG